MYERIILFLKHHWKVPAVVVLLLVCAFLYRSKVASLLGVMQQTREDYKKALDKTSEASKKTVESVSRNAIAALEQQEDRQRKLDKELKKLEEEKETLEGELEEDLERLAEEIKEKF
tara:strand:+ start:4430 stop:4780 length:351 start_codon:yes stop_codon:yes gene_type:complete